MLIIYQREIHFIDRQLEVCNFNIESLTLRCVGVFRSWFLDLKNYFIIIRPPLLECEFALTKNLLLSDHHIS